VENKLTDFDLPSEMFSDVPPERPQKVDETVDDLFEQAKYQAEEYLYLTEDSRNQAERCRDYADGKQWTDAEVQALRKRNQAPIVNNRIKVKLQGLLGLLVARRTDPKAFPRTQHEEKASEAITDALRYVADKNDLNTIKQEVADNFFCEGVGGVIIDVKANAKGENEILVEHIHWDRLYYDPYSRRRDFRDSRYLGTMTWMDEDELMDLFPDADIETMLAGTSTYETFEDRPRWIDKREKRRRFRVALHFYRKSGAWWMCVFTQGGFLLEPVESPYLDDDGLPCCPIELVGAYIDRQNNRYGEVAGFLDLQDEINHRRSKALHLLSQRQTAARKGAVKDVSAMKREMAKPDGHVEYQGERGDFEVLQTGDMAKGQFELLQEAKAEIDAQSYNAQNAGDRQNGDLSGVAINKLQQAGVTELNNLFSALNAWEKRVYRQIWARVKQFWTEEKWIRVTDDQDDLKWVGLNTKVTAQEWLEQIINDTDQPNDKRKQAAASYQFLMQAANGQDPQTAQAAQQQLQHPVDIKNNVPELDVDIILDQSFDITNIQQEQFQLLVQLSQNPNSGIDPVEIIRASQLRGKDEIIDRIEKSRAAQQQTQQQAQQIQMAEAQAKVQHTQAQTAEVTSRAQGHDANAQHTQAKTGETVSKINSSGVDNALKQAQVEQTQIENHMMLLHPPQAATLSESA
jgi:hypothetical protein